MAFKIPLAIFKTDCEIYDNCKSLMLENYVNYLESGDLLHFTNYYSLGNPKKPNTKELDKAMTDFYGDLLAISQNEKVLRRFEVIHKIMKYEMKYNDVKMLVNAIRNFDPLLSREKLLELVAQLEKWHYRIDTKKWLFDELNRIEARVEGIKTEIELLAVELKQVDTGEKTSLLDEIYNTEMFLELKFPIDLKTTSVYKWISHYKKAVENKIKLIEKNKPKK